MRTDHVVHAFQFVQGIGKPRGTARIVGEDEFDLIPHADLAQFLVEQLADFSVIAETLQEPEAAEILRGFVVQSDFRDVRISEIHDQCLDQIGADARKIFPTVVCNHVQPGRSLRILLQQPAGAAVGAPDGEVDLDVQLLRRIQQFEQSLHARRFPFVSLVLVTIFRRGVPSGHDLRADAGQPHLLHARHHDVLPVGGLHLPRAAVLDAVAPYIVPFDQKIRIELHAEIDEFPAVRLLIDVQRDRIGGDFPVRVRIAVVFRFPSPAAYAAEQEEERQKQYYYLSHRISPVLIRAVSR